MNKVTMRDLAKANKKQIRDWLPFLLTSDGEIVAKVVPYEGETVVIQRPFEPVMYRGQIG